MNKVSELKEGDYIAFGFNYHGGEPNEIMVTNITFVHTDYFIVHFLYGHHSLAETVYRDKVLAIGDPNGEHSIKGWSGKFTIVDAKNKLLKNNLKEK